MAVAGIEATLLSLHEMAAAALSAPELRLSAEEAHRLAAAIAEVNRHYSLPALKPAHQALLMLAITAGSIYRGKLSAVRTRKRAAHSGNGHDAAGGGASYVTGAGMSASPSAVVEGGWLPPLQ